MIYHLIRLFLAAQKIFEFGNLIGPKSPYSVQV